MKEAEIDYANSTWSFPQKLFALLEHDHGNIISWASHGLCFRIRDTDVFAKEIIPKYFKQTKLTSFQRQLNLYGFRRLSRGADQGCYFHPKFQREKKELMSEIKRLPIKGTLQTYDQIINASPATNHKKKVVTNDENGKLNNHSHLTRSSSHSMISSEVGGEAANKDLNTATKLAPEVTAKPYILPSVSPKVQIPAIVATQQPVTSNQFNYSHYTAPFVKPSAPISFTANPLPTMSKLTMNIGYGKHLINNLSNIVSHTQMPISNYNNQFEQSLPRSQYATGNASVDSMDSSTTQDDLDFLELFENSVVDNNVHTTMQTDYIPTFDEAVQFHSLQGSNF